MIHNQQLLWVELFWRHVVGILHFVAHWNGVPWAVAGTAALCHTAQCIS
jgi:hypothetical protein